MKILCNTRVLGSNLTGAQRYVLELTSRLSSDIELVAPQKSLGGVRGHLWEQFCLPHKVGKNLLWSPSITGPLSVKNQVVTIFDMVPFDHPEWLNPKFAAWYRFLVPKLARKVKSIIVISEFTKQRLLAYCPSVEDRVIVTPLAADPQFCPIDQGGISEMRSLLGISFPRYIVALGSLEPRKNLHRLIKAWELIHHDIPTDVYLVIAGSVGNKKVFGGLDFSDLPPRVKLVGHVKDSLLPALYSGALATVYLSMYEGFGLPPLEAMACGTPVLSSNVASIPEVVGDAGILINPLDVGGIALALKKLIEDEDVRAKLSQLGLVQASKFNWNRTAKQTLDVLHQVMNS